MIRFPSLGDSRHSRVAGLETSDVEQHASNFDQTFLRGSAVAHHDANVVFVGTQHQTLAVLGDLAAQQNVLKMVEAGKLSEGVDGREAARGRLPVRDAGGGEND